MIEVQEESGEQQESTAFARYMSDAMFLIPTPQVLQKSFLTLPRSVVSTTAAISGSDPQQKQVLVRL